MYEACLSLHSKDKVKSRNVNKIELINEIMEFKFLHCRTNAFSGYIELDHSTYDGTLEKMDWEKVELWQMYLDCYNMAMSNK